MVVRTNLFTFVKQLVLDDRVAISKIVHSCPCYLLAVIREILTADRSNHNWLDTHVLSFLDEVAEKGKYIKAELEKCSEVESVSGLGMMIGIKLKTKNAGEVAKQALDKGLLVLTAKEKVRLLPPLTITYDELKEGIEILKEILEE